MSSSRNGANSRSENNKRNSLLQALHRKGNASRLQLARTLDISNSRVCDLIEEMVEEGLLLEQAVFVAEVRARTAAGRERDHRRRERDENETHPKLARSAHPKPP